jgi:hypothetical protein
MVELHPREHQCISDIRPGSALQKVAGLVRVRSEAGQIIRCGQGFLGEADELCARSADHLM